MTPASRGDASMKATTTNLLLSLAVLSTMAFFYVGYATGPAQPPVSFLMTSTYYPCNTCSVVIAGGTCPSSCSSAVSCGSKEVDCEKPATSTSSTTSVSSTTTTITVLACNECYTSVPAGGVCPSGCATISSCHGGSGEECTPSGGGGSSGCPYLTGAIEPSGYCAQVDNPSGCTSQFTCPPLSGNPDQTCCYGSSGGCGGQYECDLDASCDYQYVNVGVQASGYCPAEYGGADCSGYGDTSMTNQYLCPSGTPEAGTSVCYSNNYLTQAEGDCGQSMPSSNPDTPLTVTPPAIYSGNTVTLSWTCTEPYSCGGVAIDVFPGYQSTCPSAYASNPPPEQYYPVFSGAGTPLCATTSGPPYPISDYATAVQQSENGYMGCQIAGGGGGTGSLSYTISTSVSVISTLCLYVQNTSLTGTYYFQPAYAYLAVCVPGDTTCYTSPPCSGGSCSGTGSGTLPPGIVGAVCGIYFAVNTVVFILALTLMILGGALYAGSHILPGQSRGVVQGYAMGLVFGGIAGAIIAIAAPFILGIVYNSPANIISAVC